MMFEGEGAPWVQAPRIVLSSQNLKARTQLTQRVPAFSYHSGQMWGVNEPPEFGLLSILSLQVLCLPCQVKWGSILCGELISLSLVFRIILWVTPKGSF